MEGGKNEVKNRQERGREREIVKWITGVGDGAQMRIRNGLG